MCTCHAHFNKNVYSNRKDKSTAELRGQPRDVPGGRQPGQTPGSSTSTHPCPPGKLTSELLDTSIRHAWAWSPVMHNALNWALRILSLLFSVLPFRLLFIYILTGHQCRAHKCYNHTVTCASLFCRAEHQCPPRLPQPMWNPWSSWGVGEVSGAGIPHTAQKQKFPILLQLKNSIC